VFRESRVRARARPTHTVREGRRRVLPFTGSSPDPEPSIASMLTGTSLVGCLEVAASDGDAVVW
jgi:hypothetical protein